MTENLDSPSGRVTAAQTGVEMTVDVHVPENISIAAIDLCSVFFNLLDNALEACQQQPEAGAKRFIGIKAGISREYLIIEIKNSKKNEIKMRNGKIITQKLNSKIHGLGLSIVQEIAEKYDGVFDIKFTDDTFTVYVALKAAG